MQLINALLLASLAQAAPTLRARGALCHFEEIGSRVFAPRSVWNKPQPRQTTEVDDCEVAEGDEQNWQSPPFWGSQSESPSSATTTVSSFEFPSEFPSAISSAPASASETPSAAPSAAPSVTPSAVDTPVAEAVTSTSAAPAATSSTSSGSSSSAWAPPSDLTTALQEVWDHEVSTYSDALGFKNYGYDQVIAAGGKFNYCVRLDSSSTFTAAQRTSIETAITRSFNKWIEALSGFDGFPYSSLNVSVVGYAVSDTSKLEGDTSNVDVYTTTDTDGIPQCDERCGRFFHQDGDYSSCPGGADRHYDMSLWLTDGMSGGAGGDWGQRIGTEYFLQNIESDNIHILLHEIGHGFALDDFYDWTPTGQSNFLMLAGSAAEITDFDKWMARDWWRNLKSRYTL